MGGVCSTHGGNEGTVLVGKTEGKTKFCVGVHWVEIVRRALKGMCVTKAYSSRNAQKI